MAGMKRASVVAALLFASTLLVATPASAKVDLTVTAPESGQAGSAVTITVTAPPINNRSVTWETPNTDILGLRRVSGAKPNRWTGSKQTIELNRQGPAPNTFGETVTFSGTVTLPATPGRYLLYPFPDGQRVNGPPPKVNDRTDYPVRMIKVTR